MIAFSYLSVFIGLIFGGISIRSAFSSFPSNKRLIIFTTLFIVFMFLGGIIAPKN